MHKNFIIGITYMVGILSRSQNNCSKYLYVRREKHFIKKPNSICIKMSCADLFCWFSGACVLVLDGVGLKGVVHTQNNLI
jgi:hypothetical protein